MRSALSTDGRLLATSAEQRDRNDRKRVLVIRDVDSWRQLQTIRLNDTGKGQIGESITAVRSIRFTADGRTVGMEFRDRVYTYSQGATGKAISAGLQIRWWDVTSGRETRAVTVAQGRICR